MSNKFRSLLLSGFLVVAAFAGVAQASVALVSGAAPVLLPGASLVAEADLAGTVIQDNLIPFRIMSVTGAPLFEGKLQNRLVRSTSTGLFHFYYRIRDTVPGLNGIVKSIWTTAFDASPRVLVDWRPDGLGLINPIDAQRSGGVGQLIRFDFNIASNVLVGGRESRFFFIKTINQKFNNLGQTRIQLRTGESVVLKTLSPVR